MISQNRAKEAEGRQAKANFSVAGLLCAKVPRALLLSDQAPPVVGPPELERPHMLGPWKCDFIKGAGISPRPTCLQANTTHPPPVMAYSAE